MVSRDNLSKKEYTLQLKSFVLFALVMIYIQLFSVINLIIAIN